MSGSSGGSPIEPEDDYGLNCDTVSLTGPVSSPQPAVAAHIQVGQRLEVVLDEDIVVLQVPGSADILGSFNHSRVVALIECIRKGYKYIGIVQSRSDGYIRVRITGAQQEPA